MVSRIVLAGVVAIYATLLLPPGEAAASDEGILASCGGCHQMKGPADKTLSGRTSRKAPPLFYAGNKFRKEWLVAWLQHPTRIRPTGDYPPGIAQPGSKSDEIPASRLIAHPALDPTKAKAAADQLMALAPNTAVLAKEKYKPGNISERLGAMNFVKFQGCAACHKDTPKYGGISGPELYSAWNRLQPAFIASYIRDPMAWEPRSMMPKKHLNDAAIKRLADYLRVIGSKGEKAK